MRLAVLVIAALAGYAVGYLHCDRWWRKASDVDDTDWLAGDPYLRIVRITGSAPAHALNGNTVQPIH